jgi:CRISPR-associated protein Csd2
MSSAIANTYDVHLDCMRRHDFVLLFDVTDGNPNGDPDAGNLPRVDPETMQGLVTDVAIKRKVRDYVDATRGTEERFKIYVQEGRFLSEKQERAYSELKLKKGSKEARDHSAAQKWMCANFYDVRTFGAVMGVTDFKAGQVRGPVQFTFARSFHRVVPMDVGVVRVALTSAKEERQAKEKDGEESTHGTMGRKPVVPYGLYRMFGFISPHLGLSLGFDGDDLRVLWESLQMMWDLDRSAARGLMACRGLYVFTHEGKFGNASAHTLLELVSARLVDGVQTPRAFTDYKVTVDEAKVPSGVTLTRLVG